MIETVKEEEEEEEEKTKEKICFAGKEGRNDDGKSNTGKGRERESMSCWKRKRRNDD